MKILINAIISKMGGIKVIVNSFIESIDECDGNEYHLLAYENSIDKDVIEKKPDNVFIHETKAGDLSDIKKFLWYQFELPKYIKKNRFDYMINLSNYGPIKPGCKQILLLNNSKHVSEEMKRSNKTKNKAVLILQDSIFRLSLIGVTKLVVQTQYMKNGVLKKFNLVDGQIAVIPNCPQRMDQSVIDIDLENRLTHFIETETNVFVNITLYCRHKNLERLIEAVRYIKETSKMQFKLVLTIDDKEGSEAAYLLSLIKTYSLEDYVMSAGNIKHEHIHQVLKRAKAFIFPSYAESFGIPYVEAMRFGLPIIAADLGFAHDVCGEAALYFRYDSVEDLAEKMITVMCNNEIHERLRQESKRRNSLFDGEEIVKAYLSQVKEENQ